LSTVIASFGLLSMKLEVRHFGDTRLWTSKPQIPGYFSSGFVKGDSSDRMRLTARWTFCLLSACACTSEVDVLTLRPVSEAVPVPPGSDCASVETDTTQSHVPLALSGVATTLEQTTIGNFTVEWALYPLPYPDGENWSIWSKGVLASNGKYYSAVGDDDSAGDADSRDGTSFLYEYDPTTGKLRAVADVLASYSQHVPGDNGYGKIQGVIGEGPCGLLYMHTFWGSPANAVYQGSYQGDLLLRYNPWIERLDSLGAQMPRTGTPATRVWRAGKLFYGEANAPDSSGFVFWVYDIARDRVVYASPERPGAARNRTIAIDLDGRAYTSDGAAGLYRYDPIDNREQHLPLVFATGGWLRASTEATSDGKLVLLTREPDEVYEFDPAQETLRHLSTLPTYVADVELDPTEQRVYFAPALPSAGEPFVVSELDRATGSVRDLIELATPLESVSGVRPQGTYSITTSRDGRSFFIAVNGGPQRGFGAPMLIVVHLPAP
jgi:hypothetical protein